MWFTELPLFYLYRPKNCLITDTNISISDAYTMSFPDLANFLAGQLLLVWLYCNTVQ